MAINPLTLREVVDPKGIEFTKGSILTYTELDENFLTLRDRCEGIDITHNDLIEAIKSETLIPGARYRLTDYRNVNWLHGYETMESNLAPDTNFVSDAVYTSDTEVLLLDALTSSDISPIGFSEKYPEDIITYYPWADGIGKYTYWEEDGTGIQMQWDSLGSFAYFDLPISASDILIGGDMYIYMEWDNGDYIAQDGFFAPLKYGINNPLFNYSSDISYTGNSNYKPMSRIRITQNNRRIEFLDLTLTDVNEFNASSYTYVYAEYKEYFAPAYGWIGRRFDTKRQINVPFDFRNNKFRRYKTTKTLYGYTFNDYYAWAPRTYTFGYVTITNSDIDLNDFIDLPSFPGVEDYSVYIGGLGLMPGTGIEQYDNNVFTYYANKLNVYAKNFYDNTFNSIKDSSIATSGNVSGNFNYAFLQSTINRNFQENLMGYVTDSEFYECYFTFSPNFGFNTGGRIYQNLFRTCNLNNFNRVPVYFNQMTGSEFSYNVLNSGLTFSTSTVDFKYVTILNDVSTITFSPGTLTSGNYAKTISKNSSGNNVISYINNTNILTISSIITA